MFVSRKALTGGFVLLLCFAALVYKTKPYGDLLNNFQGKNPFKLMNLLLGNFGAQPITNRSSSSTVAPSVLNFVNVTHKNMNFRTSSSPETHVFAGFKSVRLLMSGSEFHYSLLNLFHFLRSYSIFLGSVPQSVELFHKIWNCSIKFGTAPLWDGFLRYFLMC